MTQETQMHKEAKSEGSVKRSQNLIKKAANAKEAKEQAKIEAQAPQHVRFENLLDRGIDVRLFYRSKDFTYDQHAKPGKVYDIPKEAFDYFKSLTVTDFEESEIAGQPMKRIQRPRFGFLIP